MITRVFQLTLRQLLFRKSTLLLAGLAALPVIIGFVFSISEATDDPERWTARTLYRDMVIAVVLPLAALLLGTSALGDEFEDGTAVYLLTKPIPRWQILLPKLAGAWLITSVLLALCIVVSGLLAIGDGSPLIPAFAAAVVVGALAYCAIFVLLSVSTSRALIAGLVYVFVWEGAITGIFDGARYLSIRHYTLGLGGNLADVDPFIYNPTVGGFTAVIMFSIVIAAAVLLANRKLELQEVREPG